MLGRAARGRLLLWGVCEVGWGEGEKRAGCCRSSWNGEWGSCLKVRVALSRGQRLGKGTQIKAPESLSLSCMWWKLDCSEASTCPYTSLPLGLNCTAEIPTVTCVPSAEINEKTKIISDSGVYGLLRGVGLGLLSLGNRWHHPSQALHVAGTWTTLRSILNTYGPGCLSPFSCPQWSRNVGFFQGAGGPWGMYPSHAWPLVFWMSWHPSREIPSNSEDKLSSDAEDILPGKLGWLSWC